MAVFLTNRGTSGEGDPIDVEMHRLGAAPVRSARAIPWHVRLGLSWSSGSPPAILLLLIGAALGPRALAVLTPAVLSAIDPALPVALAALGVHVGLNLQMRRSAHDARLLAGASIEALATGAVVTAGTLLLLTPELAAPSFHAWLIAIAAGVCASMSSGLQMENGSGPQTQAMRVQHLDVVLPLIVGGVMLAWVREGSMRDAALLATHAVVLALLIGVVARLLLAKTSSDTEQRIFGAAALLLVGGLADYLSLSALLSGLIAGAFWRVAGGPAAESMRRDIGHVQHPLVALMLVVAGARMEVTLVGMTVVVAYPLLRVVGKLAGGWLAGRLVRPAPADDFLMSLVSPGIFGIAFAMNTVRSAGPQADTLLGIVVIGTIVSQLIAASRTPRELYG